MNDQNASRVLREASSDFTPDVERLVSGGIARGRVLRRRRRVGTTLAAAAVVGVIGVAVSVGPGIIDRGQSGGSGPADEPSSPKASEKGPVDPPPKQPVDPRLAVPAEDVPATFAELLPAGDPGKILTDPPYPLVDGRHQKIVHFLWDDTLTTFVVDRSDSLGSCRQMAEGSGDGCVVEDGVEILRTGPTTADGVTAQGVSAWQHGYVVSVVSYNAADGKDVPTVTDVPPISIEQLTALVTSQVWFATG